MERAAYGRAYPGGTHLGDWKIEQDWFWGTLNAAQILKHPLVVKVEGAALKFYALPTE
jgi:hypothetical protein